MFRSTKEVAMVLGVSPSKLSRAVWEGRLDPPERGPSGAFLWEYSDIERASWALLGMDLDRVLSKRGGDRGKE